MRLARTPSSKITPVDRAVAYQDLWLRASAAMARADGLLGKDHAEWAAIRADLDKYLKHAQFQLRLAMAEDGHALYVETGHDSGYYLAERSYRGAAGLAKELSGTGLGLAHIPALVEMPPASTEPARWPERSARPELKHTPPARARAGSPVSLQVQIPAAARADRIRLYWRDGGDFQMLDQAVTRPIFTVTPTRELVYYFEILRREDSGWFHPDPMAGPALYRVSVDIAAN